MVLSFIEGPWFPISSKNSVESRSTQPIAAEAASKRKVNPESLPSLVGEGQDGGYTWRFDKVLY
jgi:hypothetical protein